MNMNLYSEFIKVGKNINVHRRINMHIYTYSRHNIPSRLTFFPSHLPIAFLALSDLTLRCSGTSIPSKRLMLHMFRMTILLRPF